MENNYLNRPRFFVKAGQWLKSSEKSVVGGLDLSYVDKENMRQFSVPFYDPCCDIMNPYRPVRWNMDTNTLESIFEDEWTVLDIGGGSGPSYGFFNGIQPYGDDVGLGGQLIEAATFLDLNGNALIIADNSNLSTSSVTILSDSSTMGATDTLGNVAQIVISESGISLIDNINNKGPVAGGDYELNYEARSYTSKQYVDTLVQETIPYSIKKGAYSITGDGVSTTYYIPHGGTTTPSSVFLQQINNTSLGNLLAYSSLITLFHRDPLLTTDTNIAITLNDPSLASFFDNTKELHIDWIAYF